MAAAKKGKAPSRKKSLKNYSKSGGMTKLKG